MKFKKYIFQLAGSLQQEDEVTKAARVIDHFPTIYIYILTNGPQLSNYSKNNDTPIITGQSYTS